MHSRDGDVHGVRHGVGRHDRFSKKSRTKLSDRRRESERRNVPQHVIASLGGLRIPAACLLMHQFRHEQRKRQTPGRPPIERGPLVSGGHQVRTDASRQIADDCRLQVHGRHDAGSIVAGLLIRQFSTQGSDVHDERVHARAGAGFFRQGGDLVTLQSGVVKKPAFRLKTIASSMRGHRFNVTV